MTFKKIYFGSQIESTPCYNREGGVTEVGCAWSSGELCPLSLLCSVQGPSLWDGATHIQGVFLRAPPRRIKHAHRYVCQVIQDLIKMATEIKHHLLLP